MSRRKLLVVACALGLLAGDLLAAPLRVGAAGKMPRIGMLDYSAPDPARLA